MNKAFLIALAGGFFLTTANLQATNTQPLPISERLCHIINGIYEGSGVEAYCEVAEENRVRSVEIDRDDLLKFRRKNREIVTNYVNAKKKFDDVKEHYKKDQEEYKQAQEALDTSEDVVRDALDSCFLKQTKFCTTRRGS